MSLLNQHFSQDPTDKEEASVLATRSPKRGDRQHPQVQRFAVLLHGTGLRLLARDGTERQGGVYVWRVVDALSGERAVALALTAVWKDPVFVADIRNLDLTEISFEAREVNRIDDGESGACIFYIDDQRAELPRPRVQGG